jgi:hypothetical protein
MPPPAPAPLTHSLPPLPTPCSSELFAYKQCIFYAVVTSMISLDRVALRKRVVDAPEILTVIGQIPHLSEFVNSLYNCQYKSFFQVGAGAGQWGMPAGCWCALAVLHACCVRPPLVPVHVPVSVVSMCKRGLGLTQARYCSVVYPAYLPLPCSLPLLPPPTPQAFVEVMELIKSDMYLSTHARYYMREVRVLVYSQVSRAGGHGCTAGCFSAGAGLHAATAQLVPGAEGQHSSMII